MFYGDERNKEAFEYNCAVHKELMSICNPLFINLGVKNFRYMKIYNNYKYISLGTNLNYLKAYLQNITQPGKFLEPSKIYSNGLMDSSNFYNFLWPAQYKLHKEDPAYSLIYEFDIWYGFTISRIGTDYIETWAFTADRESTEMPHFYLKNTNVFKCFVLYFEGKVQEILNKMPKSALATFITPFDMNINSFNTPNIEGIFNFFKSLDLSNFPIIANDLTVRLTNKELECFTHISLGSTAKQVGKLLSISSRTVETHFKSIKEKLGRHYKSDITSIIPHEQLLLLKNIFLMKENGNGKRHEKIS